MEAVPVVAVRVVRGPDWCWEEQDGGEGGVGTVVAVTDEGQSAEVQWDCGIRACYRCGREGKFDLRAFDTAPTGIFFPDVTCAGCYVEGVAGIHWQCAHCYEYYLCHSCYLQGRHCQEHPFFRIQSKKQTHRMIVAPRLGSSTVQTKGIFPGAEVIRGANWKFGDQDGGTGISGTVLTVEDWRDLSARSIAKVKWSANESINVYRVGHRAKVDLKCTSVGNGTFYYPDHLLILGQSGRADWFDEEEVVAGDVVKVELDMDVFRMIHEAAGLWSEKKAALVEERQCGTVLSVLDGRELYCCFERNMQLFTICLDTVSKLKHCRVGTKVRICDDVGQLAAILSPRSLWTDDFVMILGQVGRVTKISFHTRVKVVVNGREWIMSPLCFHLIDDESVSCEDEVIHLGHNHSMLHNMSEQAFRDHATDSGLLNEALLDGDCTAATQFLHSNTVAQKGKESLLLYYSLSGLLPAMKILLDAGVYPHVPEEFGPPAVLACLLHRQEAACRTLVEAGADVNCRWLTGNNNATLLMVATIHGSPKIVRLLANHPQVEINSTEPQEGNTAVHFAAKLSNHLGVAYLLSAGADPNLLTATLVNAVDNAATCGLVSVMEIFAAYAPQCLNQQLTEGGAPIHFAARSNNCTIINLLASQNTVDIDSETGHKATALHYAMQRGHWNAVECLVGWGAALNSIDRNGDTPLNIVIRLKDSNSITSPQLQKVHEELTAATGRAAKGFVVVACFLIREGADWNIKNNKGVSPRESLPPEIASIITANTKNRSKCYHGSLRSSQLQRAHVLPQKYNEAPSSDSGSTAAESETKSFSDSKPVSVQLPTASVDVHFSSGTVTSTCDSVPKLDNYSTHNEHHLSKSSFSTSTDPTSLTAPCEPVANKQHLCFLCDGEACVEFSPCGHIVLCSQCAQRAKRCFECQAAVESTTTVPR